MESRYPLDDAALVAIDPPVHLLFEVGGLRQRLPASDSLVDLVPRSSGGPFFKVVQKRIRPVNPAQILNLVWSRA